MRIGDLAARTGVSLRMLRYYEQAGLLTPGRSGAGQRVYTPDDVETVRRILLLKRSGLTLPAMRALLGCVRSGERGLQPCAALKAKGAEQMQRIDSQVAALLASRQLLADMIG